MSAELDAAAKAFLSEFDQYLFELTDAIKKKPTKRAANTEYIERVRKLRNAAVALLSRSNVPQREILSRVQNFALFLVNREEVDLCWQEVISGPLGERFEASLKNFEEIAKGIKDVPGREEGEEPSNTVISGFTPSKRRLRIMADRKYADGLADTLVWKACRALCSYRILTRRDATMRRVDTVRGLRVALDDLTSVVRLLNAQKRFVRESLSWLLFNASLHALRVARTLQSRNFGWVGSASVAFCASAISNCEPLVKPFLLPWRLRLLLEVLRGCEGTGRFGDAVRACETFLAQVDVCEAIERAGASGTSPWEHQRLIVAARTRVQILKVKYEFWKGTKDAQGLLESLQALCTVLPVPPPAKGKPKTDSQNAPAPGKATSPPPKGKAPPPGTKDEAGIAKGPKGGQWEEPQPFPEGLTALLLECGRLSRPMDGGHWDPGSGIPSGALPPPASLPVDGFFDPALLAEEAAAAAAQAAGASGVKEGADAAKGKGADAGGKGKGAAAKGAAKGGAKGGAEASPPPAGDPSFPAPSLSDIRVKQAALLEKTLSVALPQAETVTALQQALERTLQYHLKARLSAEETGEKPPDGGAGGGKAKAPPAKAKAPAGGEGGAEGEPGIPDSEPQWEEALQAAQKAMSLLSVSAHTQLICGALRAGQTEAARTLQKTFSARLKLRHFLSPPIEDVDVVAAPREEEASVPAPEEKSPSAGRENAAGGGAKAADPKAHTPPTPPTEQSDRPGTPVEVPLNVPEGWRQLTVDLNSSTRGGSGGGGKEGGGADDGAGSVGRNGGSLQVGSDRPLRIHLIGRFFDPAGLVQKFAQEVREREEANLKERLEKVKEQRKVEGDKREQERLKAEQEKPPTPPEAQPKGGKAKPSADKSNTAGGQADSANLVPLEELFPSTAALLPNLEVINMAKKELDVLLSRPVNRLCDVRVVFAPRLPKTYAEIEEMQEPPSLTTAPLLKNTEGLEPPKESLLSPAIGWLSEDPQLMEDPRLNTCRAETAYMEGNCRDDTGRDPFILAWASFWKRKTELKSVYTRGEQGHPAVLKWKALPVPLDPHPFSDAKEEEKKRTGAAALQAPLPSIRFPWIVCLSYEESNVISNDPFVAARAGGAISAAASQRGLIAQLSLSPDRLRRLRLQSQSSRKSLSQGTPASGGGSRAAKADPKAKGGAPSGAAGGGGGDDALTEEGRALTEEAEKVGKGGEGEYSVCRFSLSSLCLVLSS
uniref:Uncharacterized protein n=1 Tax=Chromera velia CCMP2878 TaxID=1169474 RepID=A0A0G4F3C9_9ALVE|eukprot:Cvel_14882.t1-p1 / transcript=Cvel_14882.t1 / gene=Cvel_14882 / organism=Chromera_velia_CCMP2878 / gene_product=hypothetical protein / transcript_product=hypothetical protein / location=Cvel_scaffold1076:45867-51487(+) / protein_length=1224 / sequence_SO=supercontig / SO=protein_coding / is_pseudo=false